MMVAIDAPRRPAQGEPARATPVRWPRRTGAARRLLRVPPLLYRIGLARQAGKRFLLLTTTGRKSGRAHTCALNYVWDGGEVCVFAGGGPRTDWYRNALARPDVRIRLGEQEWGTRAVPVTDSAERVRLVDRLIEGADAAGPPRPVRRLFKRLGFDYDAEVRKAAGLAPHMPILRLRVPFPFR